jgi:hypothetical protein
VAAEDDLSVGAGSAGRFVVQEFEFTAQPVNTNAMMILAQHRAISDAGLAAVLFVLHVVDIAGRGAAVAAAGPRAALVTGDDGR